ncbi:ATP-binding protein [bacterium]|nr:ATP-binding protein [bacterium]
MHKLIKKYLDSLDDSITQEDFQRLAASGETRFVERKSLRLMENTNDFIKKISQNISAFANYDGGVILLGVDNQGNIEPGTDDKQGKTTKLDWLRDITNSCLTPLLDTITVKILKQEIDNNMSHVYAIFIPQGNKAYQASDHRCYAKLDGKLRPIDGNMVIDILNRKRLSNYKVVILFNGENLKPASTVTLQIYIEVINETPLEDSRLKVKSFGEQRFSLSYNNPTRVDEVEKSFYHFEDKKLLFPGERFMMISGSLTIQKSPLDQKYIEISVYARNAQPFQQSFVIDAREHQYIYLYEYPIPKGNIESIILWRYSDGSEEIEYTWDSSLDDRRSPMVKEFHP